MTFDNKVKVYTDGPELFRQMIEDIRNAKESVSLEFYTFYADHLGNRVLAALEEAASNGAKVRIIYDVSGSRGTKPAFFDHLRELGGEAQSFISTSKKHWFTTPRLNYHLHRKLVIIDHKIGYIGGFNIGDQYVNQSKKFWSLARYPFASNRTISNFNGSSLCNGIGILLLEEPTLNNLNSVNLNQFTIKRKDLSSNR